MESAFTQQPAQLANPVPSEMAQPDNPFKAAMAAAPSGPIELNSGQPPVAEEVNPFKAAMAPTDDSLTLDADNNLVTADMSTEPAPTGIASAMEQLREAGARFRNAWTVSDAESLNTLKGYPELFDDVRVKNDTVQVKRKGRKGWEKFDRDKAELLGDALDMVRMVFEGIAEGGMEMAGTAKLAATTGGIGLVEQAAVGSASAVGAMTAGDAIAEHLIGIERDPKRSRATETSMAAAFGAGFTWLSGSLARKAAAKKLNKEALDTTKGQIASKLDEATEQVKVLTDSGIELNPNTGQVFLTPGQASANPELIVFEKELSKKPAYRNFVEKQGQALKEGYEALALGVNQAMGKTGTQFNIQFKDMGKFYGKQIEGFRELAKKELKDLPQPAANTTQNVGELLQNIDGTKPFKERAAQFNESFPALTENQANIVLKAYDGVGKKLAGGGQISVKDIDGIYNKLRNQIDNSYGTISGQPVADALIPLKNAVRDDYTQMIGKVLPEDQKGAYEAFMKKYSDFKVGEGELRGLLKKSALSRKALVSTMFEGKNSLSLAKTTKAILDDQDPKFFKELATDYFSKLLNDAVDPDMAGNVNWKSIARKFGANERTGLGKEMQELLLNGADMKKEQFNALLNIGQIIQKTQFKPQVAMPEGKLGMIRSMWNLIATKGAAQSSAAERMAEKMSFKDGTTLVEYLKDGGYEEVLKQFPNFDSRKASYIADWLGRTPGPIKAGLKTKSRMDIQQGNAGLMGQETQVESP